MYRGGLSDVAPAQPGMVYASSEIKTWFFLSHVLKSFFSVGKKSKAQMEDRLTLDALFMFSCRRLKINMLLMEYDILVQITIKASDALEFWSFVHYF